MKKFFGVCVLTLILTAASTAHAAYSVSFNAGTTNTTTALTGFSTTGAMMDGMKVTAFFADNTIELAIWGDTGANSGSAAGTGWRLDESGDTYGGIWSLYNNSGKGLSKLLIDAGPGDTVFDIDYAGGFGTAGSANGWTFQVYGNTDAGLNIAATYIDEVALGDDAPVGDLWRYLEIDFAANGSALASGQYLRYITDTDNIKFAGDLNPRVPEPAAIAVWSVLSVVGLGLIRRSRRSK
jgi:hypothetical protein